MKMPRFRAIGLLGGSLAILAWIGFTHPGAATIEEHLIIIMSIVAKFATPVLAVLFAFLARKALLDYKGFDVEDYLNKAKESAVGAGLVFLGICILMFGLLGLFGNQVNAQEVKTYIPPQAKMLLPTLKAEQEVLWPEHPKAGHSELSQSTSLVLA